MDREKEIEEMAEAIFQNCNCGLFFSEAEKIARFVIEEQGYRKQSEVVKEIFEEVRNVAKTVGYPETMLVDGTVINCFSDGLYLAVEDLEYIENKYLEGKNDAI